MTFYFVIIIIFGCEYTERNSINVNTVDLTNSFNNEKKIGLNEIAENVEYIKLETNPNCLISRIEKIKIIDNYILIKDRNFKTLLIFDTNGSFIHKIDKVGKGPNEYFNIFDFSYDPENKCVYIFDNFQWKVIIYNLNNEVITNFRLKFQPWNIEFLNDGKVAFYMPRPKFHNTDNSRVIIMNNKGKKIKKLLIHNSNEYSLDDATRFFKLFIFHDTLSCWGSYYDTIYRITSDYEVIPAYYIENTKNKMPLEQYSINSNFNERIKRYSSIYNLFETTNYIFFKALQKTRLKGLLYNKKSKISFSVRSGFEKSIHHIGFYNDFDGGIPFWPIGVSSNGHPFMAVDILEILDFIKQNELPTLNIESMKKNQELLELLENSQISDNPIIMAVIPK